MMNRVCDFEKECMAQSHLAFFDNNTSLRMYGSAMMLLLLMDIVISAIFHFGLIKPLTFKLSK